MGTGVAAWRGIVKMTEKVLKIENTNLLYLDPCSISNEISQVATHRVLQEAVWGQPLISMSEFFSVFSI